jgi:hypothetical protein
MRVLPTTHRFNDFMTCKRFEAILLALSYTAKTSPAYTVWGSPSDDHSMEQEYDQDIHAIVGIVS